MAAEQITYNPRETWAKHQQYYWKVILKLVQDEGVHIIFSMLYHGYLILVMPSWDKNGC